MDRFVGGRLAAHVLQRRPRAVLTTHFYPLAVLARLRRAGTLDARLVAIVTDYVAHALWAVAGADLYCTPCDGAAQDLVALGVPPGVIIETGVPVRPRSAASRHGASLSATCTFFYQRDERSALASDDSTATMAATRPAHL